MKVLTTNVIDTERYYGICAWAIYEAYIMGAISFRLAQKANIETCSECWAIEHVGPCR